ncbi:MAG: serine protease [Alteromonadaceae bacterium]|jgi:serine protease
MLKNVLILLASASLITPTLAQNNNSDPTAIVIIADTIKRTSTLAPLQNIASGLDSSNEIEVTKTGSVFIKVHFNYFNIPTGAYVVVSDPLGQESYQYDGIEHQTATFSAAENGLTQFSAMSIFGDTAVVKLVMPLNAVWEKQHGIKIDQFNAGLEQALIPENDPTPESSCGVNERRDAICWQSSHTQQYERTRPVARLLMGGTGLCTSWRVGDDNHMFTNNHCLSTQSKLTNTEVWFNYQRTTCGGSTNAGTIKVTGKDLLKTDYDLDYSLFTVTNFNSISSFGNFGLEDKAPTVGDLIYIAQHGAGKPKELAIESDQNTNGLCQIDIASATGRAANTDTGYFCDTTGGSSGSPVIDNASHKVIALHHFGGCENQGVRIDKIWPQVSTYFGGVLPQGDGPGQSLPPVARAQITCNNLSCSFNGSGSTGSNLTYHWNFGDSLSATTSSIQHDYAQAGTYQVSLTVTDNKNASNTYNKVLEVSDSQTDNELQSGIPVLNLAGAKDSESLYFIDVSDSNKRVVVNMSGGSGDADLYVKRGAEPTTSDYDCRPFEGGNNESCDVNLDSPELVYIKLIGYSQFSGVELVATISDKNTSQFPKSNLETSKGNWLRYDYTVPAGVSQIEVKSFGGSGDADLYVQKSVAPSKTVYDCRPFQSGNNESCTLSVTAGDQIHIGLFAYNSFANLTLDVVK